MSFKNILPLNIAKNFSWLALGEGTGMFLFYVTNIYIARVLDIEMFGNISFAFAMLPLLMLFTDMGLSLYGIREVAKGPDSFLNISKMILPLRLTLSVIVFILSSLLVLLFSQDLNISIILITAFLYVIPYSISLDWAFKGSEKMKYSALWLFLQNFIFLILVILFIKSTEQATSIPLLRLIGIFVASIVLIRIGFKSWHINLNFKINYWKDLLKSSSAFMASVLGGAIFLNLDSILLGIMDSSHAIGIYSAAFRIFNIFFGIIFAFVLAHAPEFSRLKNKAVILYTDSFSKRVHLITFFPTLFLLIFSDEIISTLYGVAYQEASLVLKMLGVALFFQYLSNIYLTPLLFSGKERSYLISIYTAVIINAFINSLLIPILSFKGAAIAAIFGNGILYLSGLIIFSIAFSLKRRAFLNEIFRTLILISTIGVIYLSIK